MPFGHGMKRAMHQRRLTMLAALVLVMMMVGGAAFAFAASGPLVFNGAMVINYSPPPQCTCQAPDWPGFGPSGIRFEWVGYWSNAAPNFRPAPTNPQPPTPINPPGANSSNSSMQGGNSSMYYRALIPGTDTFVWVWADRAGAGNTNYLWLQIGNNPPAGASFGNNPDNIVLRGFEIVTPNGTFVYDIQIGSVTGHFTIEGIVLIGVSAPPGICDPDCPTCIDQIPCSCCPCVFYDPNSVGFAWFVAPSSPRPICEDCECDENTGICGLENCECDADTDTDIEVEVDAEVEVEVDADTDADASDDNDVETEEVNEDETDNFVHEETPSDEEIGADY